MTKYPLFIIGLLLLASCNDNPGQTDTEQENLTEMPEDFQQFYEQFHRDSLYQIERIQFPLQGVRTDETGPGIVNGIYYRAREDWRMHRPLTRNSGFLKKQILVNEDLIEEAIVDEKGLFGMKRRFAKFGEEWYLIYYSGMNHIAQE